MFKNSEGKNDVFGNADKWPNFNSIFAKNETKFSVDLLYKYYDYMQSYTKEFAYVTG